MVLHAICVSTVQTPAKGDHIRGVTSVCGMTSSMTTSACTTSQCFIKISAAAHQHASTQEHSHSMSRYMGPCAGKNGHSQAPTYMQCIQLLVASLGTVMPAGRLPAVLHKLVRHLVCRICSLPLHCRSISLLPSVSPASANSQAGSPSVMPDGLNSSQELICAYMQCLGSRGHRLCSLSVKPLVPCTTGPGQQPFLPL